MHFGIIMGLYLCFLQKAKLQSPCKRSFLLANKTISLKCLKCVNVFKTPQRDNGDSFEGLPDVNRSAAAGKAAVG